MIENAKIKFKNGDFFLTQIDTERDPPDTLATRIYHGGVLVCKDKRWRKARTIIINLGNVQSIVLEDAG